MADAQLKLSRRTLLGAVCVLPSLPRHSGLDPESTFLTTAEEGRWIPGQARNDESAGSFAVAKWDRVLASLRRAEAAVTALEGHPDEAAFGRAHDRFNAALRRLLEAPAPDLPALATKLETAVAAELADLIFAPPALAALAADARRLSLPSS